MTSVLHSQLKKEAITINYIPTLKFVGIGVLWIVVSDLVLFLSQNTSIDHFPIFHLEILKGILFVVAMGIFFFVIQRKSQVDNRELVDQDLFRKNPQAMFIYHLETFEFLDVNEAAVSIYGYSREEFLSMKITDIRPAEDLPALVKAVEQLQSGYRFIGNSRHIHKNRSIVHMEVSAFSITYNREHAGLIMSTDISNQVKAEQALVEFTKMHEKQMNDRVYQVALFNKELQIRIREINANNDELIEVNKLLQNANRTAVARYEAKIQRMQRLIHDLAEGATDVFWIIDLHDANGTSVSQAALALYGCTRRCVLDEPNFWEDSIHRDDRAKVKTAMLQLNNSDAISLTYRHTNGLSVIRQEVRLIRGEDEKVEKIFYSVKPSIWVRR